MRSAIGTAMAAVLALSACEGTPAQVVWALDVSEWPSCGWKSTAMVYTTRADVRMHDRASGDNAVVWSYDALVALSGLDPLAPIDISLARDRRWMAVSLTPPIGPSQIYALSCDGVTAQRIGPADAGVMMGPLISPDGRKMALVHGHSSAPGVPDALLLLTLETGGLRKIANFGVAFQWSPDSRRLFHETTADVDSPVYLALMTLEGSEPDYVDTRPLDLYSRCAWDGTSDYAYCTGAGTVRWPFDPNLAIERVAPNVDELGRAEDGTLYGTFGVGDLVEVDVVANKLTFVWPDELPPIAYFAL